MPANALRRGTRQPATWRRRKPLAAPPSGGFGPAGPVTGIAWSPDGRWLAVSHTTTPYVTAYEWTAAGFGEKLTAPSTLPAGNGQAIAFNPAGTLLAVGHATTPFMSVYKWGGGFSDKLSDPGTLPASAANSVAFSPDGQYVAAATDTTPYVRAWPIHPRTGFGSILAAPSAGPGAAAKGALFSSAGRALGSTLANSYRLSRPTWEVQAQFAREAYYKAVMALNPSSYWRLDETSGSTASDVMRAAQGTYTGSPMLGQASLLASDEGYAVDFNGSSQYVACGDNYDLTGTMAASIAFLVNPDTLTGDPLVISKLGIDGGGVQGWDVILTSGVAAMRRWLNSGVDSAAAAITTGVVSHVVAVYDGAAITIYVNGAAGTPVASTRAILNTAFALEVGRWSGGQYLDGRLDEVAIWAGTALSAAQVLALYNASAAFGTDLRPYIEGPLTVRRGLAPDGRPLVGQLAIELDNESGIFTAENPSSALYGLLEPYVPIRVRCTDPTTGIVQPVWRGQIMRYLQDYPRMGDRPRLTIECESRLGHLQRVRPSTYTAASAPDTDGAIAILLASAGLRTVDYDLDDDTEIWTGNYAPDYHADVLTQLGLLALGSGATFPNLFEGKDGKVRYRSKTTLGGVAGATDRWGDYSVVKPVDLGYDARHDDRISSVVVTNSNSIPAAETPNPAVYTYPRGSVSLNSVALAAGQSLTIEEPYGTWASTTTAWAKVPRMVTTVITPVSGTDYLGNANAAGSGANMTANLSLTFSDGGTGFKAVITNTHASTTVYLTLFKIRASNVDVALATDYRLDDPLYRSAELSPALSIDYKWGSYGKLGAAMLLSRRYAIPRLTMEFDWDSDAIQTAMLLADLCELVEVEDATGLFATAVRDCWIIESIAHTFYPQGNAGRQINRSTVTLRPSWASLYSYNAAADAFEKANRSTALGAPSPEWSNASSWFTFVVGAGLSWSISSSQAAPDSATEGWTALDTAAGSYNSGQPGKDMMAKVLLSGLLDAGSTWKVGLVYRCSMVFTHWRVQIDRQALALQLIYRSAGGAGIDHIVTSVPWTLEDTAELRVVAQGTRHRVYLNGAAQPVIDTVEDRGLLTGSLAGLYAINGASVRFKRFAACGMN